MGRHVNFQDEQDRWLNKAEKINRKFRKQKLEERDPNSLTLAEQFELEKRKQKERQRVKEEQFITPKPKPIRFSHYKSK
jgi:hypothetical protein